MLLTLIVKLQVEWFDKGAFKFKGKSLGMRLLFGVLGTNNQPAAKECKLVIVIACTDYVHCTIHRMNNIMVVDVCDCVHRDILPSISSHLCISKRQLSYKHSAWRYLAFMTIFQEVQKMENKEQGDEAEADSFHQPRCTWLKLIVPCILAHVTHCCG